MAIPLAVYIRVLGMENRQKYFCQFFQTILYYCCNGMCWLVWCLMLVSLSNLYTHEVYWYDPS